MNFSTDKKKKKKDKKNKEENRSTGKEGSSSQLEYTIESSDVTPKLDTSKYAYKYLHLQ